MLAASGLANIAFSQGAANGGGSGGFGGNATGGFGAGGATGGSSFGTSGSTFGTSGSTTGTSGSRFGTSGTSTSGTSGNSGNSGTGAQGMSGTGAERKLSDVGKSNNGGVGGAANARGGLGGGGLGGGRLGGGGFGGLSPFGLNPFGTGGGTTETKPTLRTLLKSGIVMPPRTQTNAQISQSIVQQRVNGIVVQPRFRGVGVAVNGSTTVLDGTVANDADRRMAELLLRLEPGVSNVENRITVSP
jgi:hypothetical protein